MILLLTDEVSCPPKSMSAVILVCGSSWWVLVWDVLHLRLTACHIFCRACLGVCVSKVAQWGDNNLHGNLDLRSNG